MSNLKAPNPRPASVKSDDRASKRDARRRVRKHGRRAERTGPRGLFER